MARRIFLNDTLPPLLEAKGWTQERLAEATGIRRTDINAICKGRTSVGPDRLQRIAGALEVSLLDLDVGDPAELAARSAVLRDRVAVLESALDEVRRELAELRRRQDDGR